MHRVWRPAAAAPSRLRPPTREVGKSLRKTTRRIAPDDRCAIFPVALAPGAAREATRPTTHPLAPARVTSPIDALRASLADRYEIDREVGADDLRTVYHARDMRLTRDVRLSVVRPSLAASLGAARFLIFF